MGEMGNVWPYLVNVICPELLLSFRKCIHLLISIPTYIGVHRKLCSPEYQIVAAFEPTHSLTPLTFHPTIVSPPSSCFTNHLFLALVLPTSRLRAKPIVRIAPRTTPITPMVLPAVLAADPVPLVGERLARRNDTPGLESRPEAQVLVHCEPGATAAARYVCARKPPRLVGIPTDDAFAQAAAPDLVRFESPRRDLFGIADLLRVKDLARVRVPAESGFDAKPPFDGMPVIPHLQWLRVPSIVLPPDLAHLDGLVMRGPLGAVRGRDLAGVDVPEELDPLGFECWCWRVIRSFVVPMDCICLAVYGVQWLLRLKTATNQCEGC